MAVAPSRIRVVALAIVRRPETGELLVFEGRDPSRDLVYHRPLGGEVEFGETAFEAVVRELEEEIGVAVTPRRLLGACESIFVEGGAAKHEIVLLVECGLADAALYEKELFPDLEGHGEHGIWRKLDEPITLFPDRLVDFIWPAAAG